MKEQNISVWQHRSADKRQEGGRKKLAPFMGGRQECSSGEVTKVEKIGYDRQNSLSCSLVCGTGQSESDCFFQ